ncbi:MAG: LysR family transcriptional regulator, partial [Eisenbergiella sp.]
MTLRHMRIFVAVCECESVTAAAEKLFIAQPAASLAIAELEEYNGVKLFDRIARRLYITET